MSEEQKEALEILKGLEFEEYDWYVKTDKIEGHANDVVEKVEKALQTILNLVEKQQKEIENLKLRKDNKVIINKIDQITKEYYELFNKKMSLESMNINGHRYNAMKMVLEEVLSGQESTQEDEEVIKRRNTNEYK